MIMYLRLLVVFSDYESENCLECWINYPIIIVDPPKVIMYNGKYVPDNSSKKLIIIQVVINNEIFSRINENSDKILPIRFLIYFYPLNFID